MRDIIVSLIIFGLMPTCFRRPFVGLVMFSWLAYMRVQDLTWGFARQFRWSYYIAMITFAGFVINRQRGQRFFASDLRCYIMITLIFLVGAGLFSSRYFNQYKAGRFFEFIKIVGIALFTTAVVTNRERLRILVWVIALSLGFYGLKSGIWGIVNLFPPILRGPGGMLFDNNDFSLALSMAVPMLFHLGWTERRKPIRRTFWIMLPLTALTVLMTRSRGGFLSLSSAVGVLVWRSRNRIAGFMIAFLCGVGALLLSPAEYTDRLKTMLNPSEEGSASSRLRAWGIAIRMAGDNPIIGVGFGMFPMHYLDYCVDPTPQELAREDIIVAHSSYLQIWAECGTPAFSLYLVLIGMSLWTCWRVRQKAKQRFHSSWLINYATMFEASLVAFIVGSTFLNRAHFDLFYHWVAIVLCFGRIAEREMEDDVLYPVREGGRGRIRHVEQGGFSKRVGRDGFQRLPRPGRVGQPQRVG